MVLTDTHSHLYSEQFSDEIEGVIERCLKDKVERIFLPNIDLESIDSLKKLHQSNPNIFFPMMGLHPCSVKANFQEDLERIRQEVNLNYSVAIGEIGIDLYWDKTFVHEQMEAFRIQIGWAKELGLPIVIHARDSFDEIFEVLDSENDDMLKGVFHCFTGDERQVDKIKDYGGFVFGIGGVVTFKKSHLPEILPHIGLDNIVLETDSPYLAPSPFRGKRNESSYVKLVAAKVADVFGMSLENVADVTTNNSVNLFGI